MSRARRRTATSTRAFFKDVLQWPFVSEGARGDAGTGTGAGGVDPAEWLIFATGRSELGVHPLPVSTTATSGARRSTTRSQSCATTWTQP